MALTDALSQYDHRRFERMTFDEQLAELQKLIVIERILHGLTPDGRDDHAIPSKDPA